MAQADVTQQWICCQIGAREHYAIPRALQRSGALAHFITDSWANPSSLIAVLGARNRFHDELRAAPVTGFNPSLIGFEVLARARGLTGWDKVIARNEWFQRKVVRYLASYPLIVNGYRPIVFSYSYAAREIFRFAKSQGWKTVLGQIDPGPVEEEIVRIEHEEHPEFKGDWKPAPTEYWESWREECELADRIVVNSEWSRAALIRNGVSGEKLSIIPLAYEAPETRNAECGMLNAECGMPNAERGIRNGECGMRNAEGGMRNAEGGTRNAEGGMRNAECGIRNYPDRFSSDRPLRVLFLGQINLRKGVAHLLQAASAMINEPAEFWMVGPTQVEPPQALRNLANVRWFGRMPHSAAAKFYREADVFILPTLSDGFALTQLEAQAHGLPVIASRNCGEVVKHRENGLVLTEPTSDAIVEALQFCLSNPNELAMFSAASHVENRFSLEALGQNLLSLPNL